MGRSRKELCRTIKMFCLICICQNWSELKIRLFHCVKIILQQSGPHLLLPSQPLHSPPYPPPSTLAALEHAKPNLALSLCISTWHPPSWLLAIYHSGPRPCPFHRENSLGILTYFSVYILCGTYHFVILLFTVCFCYQKASSARVRRTHLSLYP